MAISVRLDDEFVTDTQIRAAAEKRSVPKQIEHWAQIGRIVEDNPDLSYEFIKDALMATAEINAGQVTKHERRRRKTA